jgi:hypothetical protein
MRLYKEVIAQGMKLVLMLLDVPRRNDILILKFQTPRRHKSRYQATCFLARVVTDGVKREPVLETSAEGSLSELTACYSFTSAQRIRRYWT